MLVKQNALPLSAYAGLYDMVSKDNLLRRMNEVVDFSFIYMKKKNIV